MISVSDDGIGIPKENLELIFEHFFTTNSKGTGLGLAICKKLALENNARIEVFNNNEKGCTFKLIKD